MYETSHHDKSIGTKRLTIRYETFRPRSKRPGKKRPGYETTRILQFIMGKSPQRYSDYWTVNSIICLISRTKYWSRLFVLSLLVLRCYYINFKIYWLKTEIIWNVMCNSFKQNYNFFHFRFPLRTMSMLWKFNIF